MGFEKMDILNGSELTEPAQFQPDNGQSEGPHFTLLFRTAKIIIDKREFLCIIRDVSPTGVRLQIFHPLPEAAAFLLELANGNRYPIELAWSDGDFADFRLANKIHLRRLIKDPDNRHAERQIRLRTLLRGVIKSDNRVIGIQFRDVSQQGACIECDEFLAIDQLVYIETAILPPLFAKVRWRKRPHYGLIFEQTFRFAELAQRLGPKFAK